MRGRGTAVVAFLVLCRHFFAAQFVYRSISVPCLLHRTDENVTHTVLCITGSEAISDISEVVYMPSDGIENC